MGSLNRDVPSATSARARHSGDSNEETARTSGRRSTCPTSAVDDFFDASEDFIAETAGHDENRSNSPVLFLLPALRSVSPHPASTSILLLLVCGAS